VSNSRPLSPAATVTELERILTSVDRVGFDSEGQQWPTCLGFATSPADCLVVDTLVIKDKPYAGEVWGLCRAILESDEIIKYVWNAPHERAFLASSVGWHLRGSHDVMMAWHEAFPELPKGLKYAASLLTRLPCWTEGVHWGDDDEERPAISGEKLFVYNANDCLATYQLAIHPQLAAIMAINHQPR